MPLVSIRMLANDELSCIEQINMCNSGLRAMLCTPHAQIRLPYDKLKLLSTSRYLQFRTLDATCPIYMNQSCFRLAIIRISSPQHRKTQVIYKLSK